MSYRVEYQNVNNLLFKPVIIIGEDINVIPLLIEEYQIEKLNDILKNIQCDENLKYLTMKIIGAVRFAMKL
jgi:hypothetical protein